MTEPLISHHPGLKKCILLDQRERQQKAKVKQQADLQEASEKQLKALG